MNQTVFKRFEPIPVHKSRESITVPDMSYTPREIIAKFSRGERVPLGMLGKYDSEDDKDKLHDYDPTIFMEDPTRDPDFDRFDYTEEKRALDKRNRERENQKRSKVEDDTVSQRKASDEESSESEAMKRETTSGETVSSPDVQ